MVRAQLIDLLSAAELGRAEESVEEGGLRKLGKGDDGEGMYHRSPLFRWSIPHSAIPLHPAIRAELKALVRHKFSATSRP